MGVSYLLSKYLVKIISQNDGSVEMDDVKWNSVVQKYIAEPSYREDPSELRLSSFLKKNQGHFKYSVKYHGRNSLLSIELRNIPKLCEKYPTSNGCSLLLQHGRIQVDDTVDFYCEDLHLCIHYLMGDCKFKEKCKYSHNLQDRHNETILRQYLMHKLSRKELASVLKIKNYFENKRPLICKGYNSLSGCIFKEKCTSLHICLYYVQDNCKYGKNCKRSHNLLDPSVKKILSKRNINTSQKPREIILNIRKMLNISGNKDSDDDDDDDKDSFQNDDDEEQDEEIKKLTAKTGKLAYSKVESMKTMYKTPLPSQPIKAKPTKSSTETPKICTFDLRGKCLFGDNCALFHQKDKLPFQWQYEKETNKWADLEDNQSIEKAFCECLDGLKLPRKKTDDLDIEICFKSMSYKFVKVSYLLLGYIQTASITKTGDIRRLTTDSQLNQSYEYDYLTRWMWFWKDNNLKWIEYIDGLEYPSSDSLEKEYQMDSLKIFTFNVTTPIQFSYEISFEKMTQTNSQTRMVREILRRPDVYDPVHHKPLSISMVEQSNGSLKIEFPKTWGTSWKNNSTGTTKLQLVTVDKASSEFKEIEALFQQTVKIPIKSVTRIQNKELWSIYYIKKQAIIKKKPGQTVTKRLFHGTSKTLINAICHQGFDFRLSGTRVGHVYGLGSYFARDASYSCGYTDSGQLFVAEVAVGDYTKGLKDFRRPPSKPSSSLELYDSCVNDPLDPSIFVIFDNHQAYPEYLIEY